MKVVGIVVAVIAFIFILAFVSELLSLGWIKFFKPKYQNVEREVFEETKSYTHGKIQDLAKYKREYEQTEELDEKESIASLIRSQFAEFDETNIRNAKLRNFLIRIRGY